MRGRSRSFLLLRKGLWLFLRNEVSLALLLTPHHYIVTCSHVVWVIRAIRNIRHLSLWTKRRHSIVLAKQPRRTHFVRWLLVDCAWPYYKVPWVLSTVVRSARRWIYLSCWWICYFIVTWSPDRRVEVAHLRSNFIPWHLVISIYHTLHLQVHEIIRSFFRVAHIRSRLSW